MKIHVEKKEIEDTVP
jgi:hypothetical protein